MVERFRLHSMPSAQCHIRIEHDASGSTVELVSYNTSVCIIRDDEFGLNLYCSGTYSNTTARHINRFTAEFLQRSYYFECKDALIKDIGSARFQGFVPVASFVESDSEYNQFHAQIERYENNEFFDWNVKKYYGYY